MTDTLEDRNAEGSPARARDAARGARGRERRRPERTADRCPRHAVPPVAAQPAPLAELQGQPRGWWSLWIFMILFVVTLFAEFVANDKPILISYKNEYYAPIFTDYPEEVFAASCRSRTTATRSSRTRSPPTAGWSGPPIRYSYQSVNNEIPTPAPSALVDLLQGGALRALQPRRQRPELHDRQLELARHRRPGARRPRPPHLRLPHLGPVRPDPYRASAVIGSSRRRAGLFRRWVDLLFQRFIEIWSSIPVPQPPPHRRRDPPPGFWIHLGITCSCSRGSPSSAWCGPSSCARATSNTSTPRGRSSSATGRSWDGICYPTRWSRR